VVLGDREFCSVKLGNWLRAEQVYFCLRLKKNEFVEQEKGNWSELKALELSPGSSLYLAGVNVTKQKGFGVFNLAAKWRRKYRGSRISHKLNSRPNLEHESKRFFLINKISDISTQLES